MQVRSLTILLVADLFHPVHNLTVFLFLNGNMTHGSGRRGAVPVLLTGRKPDHITGPDLLHWSAFVLGPTAPCRYDESLAERVCVPRCSGARLKSHTRALDKGRIRRLKKWINPYGAGEPIGWP